MNNNFKCDMNNKKYFDNNEFEFINSKIGSYIDAAKNDIFKRRNSSSSYTNIFPSQKSDFKSDKDYSIKSLHKDITILKQLYDEEFQIMRKEIEELNYSKNKYSLENYNLEVKLHDFVDKFEEIKKANQSLILELNEVKNKNNRTEFEIQNLKLEAEKPFRENKQLRNDLEDILKKVNEKQEIANNEISYRQEIETKYKEIVETSVFERRIYKQELENYKTQLNLANDNIDKLGKPESIVEQKSTKISELEGIIKEAKDDNMHLLKKNENLKSFSEDLDNIVSRLANVRSSFGNSSSLDERNLPNRVLKSSMSYQASDSRVDENSNQIQKFEEELTRPNTSLRNLNDVSPSQLTKDPLAAISKDSLAAISKDSSAKLQSFNQLKKTIEPKNSEYKHVQSNITTRASSACSLRSENKTKNILFEQNNNCSTTDVFRNLENNIFLKKDEPKTSSLSNSIKNNTSILDASYIGNIKIHEIDKNGLYVRILNTSNTVEEDLGNFTIQQMISSAPIAVYRFPSKSIKLGPGRIVSVWCNSDEVEQQPPHTFVWKDQLKWGTGPECTTVLSKPNGQAVSWTTGCHKYGKIGLDININVLAKILEVDEHLSVYSPKRVQTPTCQINRKKLSAIFSPTKHPYGQSSSRNQESASKTDGGKSRIIPDNNFIQEKKNSQNRPIKSALEMNRAKSATPNRKDQRRSQTNFNFRKADSLLANDSDSEDDSLNQGHIYQENIRYYPQKKFI